MRNTSFSLFKVLNDVVKALGHRPNLVFSFPHVRYRTFKNSCWVYPLVFVSVYTDTRYGSHSKCFAVWNCIIDW